MPAPLEWYEDHWRVSGPDDRWTRFKRAAKMATGTLLFALALVGMQILYMILVD